LQGSEKSKSLSQVSVDNDNVNQKKKLSLLRCEAWSMHARWKLVLPVKTNAASSELRTGYRDERGIW